MPDTRRHRGPHPEDARLFAPAAQPALREAATDLNWLFDRGYAATSALALVGNRHGLTQRQRVAVARSVCAASQCQRRAAHEVPASALAEAELWIDGYNLLISLEAALGGGVLLHGRDGCFRDLASLHGTYRQVGETMPALVLAGGALHGWGVAHCRWILDRPVSNSGRLQRLMLDLATSKGWSWDVHLEFSPDHVLAAAPAIVATSDSMILDRCARWTNAARAMITTHIPAAWVVDLRGGDG